MSNSHPVLPGRRSVLGSSFLLLKPEIVFGSQANSALEVGLIGCGSRGNYIGGFFQEYTGARIVALHDPFQDRIDSARERLKIESPRTFTGLDGYKRLMEAKLDAVVIESPPYFHPEQVEAAVAAGKHVYVAKPLAVDVAGCRSILASGEKAKGRLSLLVDFQTRVQPVFQEAAARIHRGDIGAPVLGHVFYHAGRLAPRAKPGTPPAEVRLRDWVFDQVISGDIIVEQNIHVLDCANWYLQSRPLKAFGAGGRKARLDGNCWDHFVVSYWHPHGVLVDFSSAQFTKGFGDLCIRVHGSGGTADTHYGGSVAITGAKPWKGAEKDDTFKQGAITNVKNFVESVRSGRYLNNVAESVESNLTAILGRMAAYRQTVVTWDEMMRSGEKLDAKLSL